MSEIKISYTEVDEAISKLKASAETISEQKTKIKELPFYKSSFESKGQGASATHELTATGLYVLAEKVEYLLRCTREFLEQAKITWMDLDQEIGKNLTK